MTRRYLVRGLAADPFATVFWTHFTGAAPAARRMAGHFARYHARWQRSWPEFLACEDDLLAGAAANNKFLHTELDRGIGMSPRLLNSGLLVLQLGWVIASRIGAQALHVYGLDLGEGSRTYFDGRPLAAGQRSIHGEHVRTRAAQILAALHGQSTVPLINHSYFRVDAVEPAPA